VSGGSTKAYFLWPGFVARSLLLLVALGGGAAGFVAILLVFHAISTIQKPAYVAIVGANYSSARRGWLISRIRIARNVSLMIGAALAGYALEANPDLYRLFYPLAGLLGIAGLLGFLRIRVRRDHRPAPRHRRATLAQSLAAVTRDRRYLIFLAVVFISTFGGKIAIPIEPLRLQGELGLDLEVLGLIFGPACQLVGIAGFIFWGRLADRRDPSWLLAGCFVFLALRPLLYAVATPANAPALVAIGAASQRFAVAGIELCWMLAVIRFAGRKNVAVYTGAYLTLIGVRLLVGPILGNILYELGVRPVGIYWVVFAIIASGVVAMAILASRRPLPNRA
jgi:predicted MFS family arabinose efflux permease